MCLHWVVRTRFRKDELVVEGDELLLQDLKVLKRVLRDKARKIGLEPDREKDKRIFLVNHHVLVNCAAEFAHRHHALDQLPNVILGALGRRNH